MAESTHKNGPVIVIGAGIGGLSAAIRLALAGKHVVILENNPQPGGKMGQIEQGGFRWDTGPSVITMRHVFDELFNAAGQRLEDHLDLVTVDPLTRYFYPDGTVLDASRDLAQIAASIEAIEPRDVEGYLAYLAYAARIHRITGPVFIYNHPPTPASFARVPFREWFQVDPFRTMHGSIKRFVRSPHLRQLLGRFATYVGGSPYDAPATLNVIAHVELTGGVWYPRGGVYSIAQAMTRLAESVGVDIHLNSPVRQIVLDQQEVKGVIQNDGTHIAARTVIANADVTTTYKQLLPPTQTVQQRINQLEAFEPSCSGFILLLGIEGEHAQLAHHNIFFSGDYRGEFQAIFKDQSPATEPTIYVSITSKTDSGHAPPGHENWFVLVNAPPLTNQINWETEKTSYRDLILTRIAEFGLDVRDKIRAERIITPADLAGMSGAWRGALYGPSPNSKWTAFRRPHNRSKTVRGLYFTGGTTHPGGGVPMVTLSGKVAAELVLKDLQTAE